MTTRLKTSEVPGTFRRTDDTAPAVPTLHGRTAAAYNFHPQIYAYSLPADVTVEVGRRAKLSAGHEVEPPESALGMIYPAYAELAKLGLTPASTVVVAEPGEFMPVTVDVLLLPGGVPEGTKSVVVPKGTVIAHLSLLPLVTDRKQFQRVDAKEQARNSARAEAKSADLTRRPQVGGTIR